MPAPLHRSDARLAEILRALIADRYDAQARIPAGRHGGGQFTSSGGGGGGPSKSQERRAAVRSFTNAAVERAIKSGATHKQVSAIREIEHRAHAKVQRASARLAQGTQQTLFSKAPKQPGSYRLSKAVGGGTAVGIANKALVHAAAQKGLAEHAARVARKTTPPPAAAPHATTAAAASLRPATVKAQPGEAKHFADLAAGASDETLKRAARSAVRNQKTYRDMHQQTGGTDAGIAQLHETVRQSHLATVAEMKKRGLKVPKGETDEPLTVAPARPALRVVEPPPPAGGYFGVAPVPSGPVPAPPTRKEIRQAERDHAQAAARDKAASDARNAADEARAARERAGEGDTLGRIMAEARARPAALGSYEEEVQKSKDRAQAVATRETAQPIKRALTPVEKERARKLEDAIDVLRSSEHQHQQSQSEGGRDAAAKVVRAARARVENLHLGLEPGVYAKHAAQAERSAKAKATKAANAKAAQETGYVKSWRASSSQDAWSRARK
jgi:hypothetical protein